MVIRNNNKNGRRRRGKKRSTKTSNHLALVSAKLNRALAGVKPDNTFIRNWPPRRLFVSFKWDIAFSVTTTTALVESIFSGNNPFDPGLALSATQPQWFDQITAFYVRYRCWSSSITVRCTSDSTDEPTDLVLYPTRSPTGVITFSSSAAQPFSVVKQGGIATGASKVSLRKRMDSSKMFGSPIQLSEDYSGATAVGTLTNQWYWILVQVSADDTTSATNDYMVTMYMNVELFDRGWSELSTASIIKERKERLDVMASKVKNKAYFLTKKFRETSLGENWGSHLLSS